MPPPHRHAQTSGEKKKIANEATPAVGLYRLQELVYREGNLVSGSLEALVQHMVPTEEYYPDRAYLFAFLLSARLFIKPHELLGEVCALCEHQQNLNGEGGKVSVRRRSCGFILYIYIRMKERFSRRGANLACGSSELLYDLSAARGQGRLEFG